MAEDTANEEYELDDFDEGKKKPNKFLGWVGGIVGAVLSGLGLSKWGAQTATAKVANEAHLTGKAAARASKLAERPHLKEAAKQVSQQVKAFEKTVAGGAKAEIDGLPRGVPDAVRALKTASEELKTKGKASLPALEEGVKAASVKLNKLTARQMTNFTRLLENLKNTTTPQRFGIAIGTAAITIGAAWLGSKLFRKKTHVEALDESRAAEAVPAR